ncbi:uncharacterized protein LOC132741732 isoform X1 [Ruditapes philippinarum]|uniref:uncharacterized protein LOC132741732 isoform X1 n=1 Tax=Ruditapes philippinarum TaxID=129788 RepID=UPI00295AFEAF|nr:uncharacterized protein LOC132741732 isoform X1 [Ruditapes philippinarum]
MDQFESCEAVSLTKPFEVSGECSDEIVFTFDDGKKLYVSKNFLCYTSPVFKEMFKEKYGGTETKVIEMNGNSSDFLELLLTLHPGVQKPIDSKKVLCVVTLVEKYQIQPSIRRCQNVMKRWLTSEVDSAVKVQNNENRVTHVRTCLTVLIKAISLGYDDVVAHAVDVLARFGHDMFTGSGKKSSFELGGSFNFGTPVPTINPDPAIKIDIEEKVSKGSLGDDESINSTATKSEPECPLNACKELFESLPANMKTRLLLQRLKLCDNCLMRKTTL